MSDPAHTLLIRAHDAGHTYLSFRWLNAPESPEVLRVEGPVMAALVAELDDMLPADEETTSRALAGPLTEPDSELKFARRVAELLIPPSVRDRIGTARSPLDIRITPSRALARVPFELLAVDGFARLIEAGTVTVEPPAAVHVGRSRPLTPWAEARSRPVAYVLDPRIPALEGLHSVLGADRAALDAQFGTRKWTPNSGKRLLTRWQLSDDLRAGASRLLYIGHVSSTLEQPGSASLHLADRGTDYGLADGASKAHRPLSALDLLYGTAMPELGPAERIQARFTGQSGPDLWPMPPRVAIIACEGGVDYRSAETFGLVMALFNAGAELVTTTRWVLPTDRAFAVATGGSTVPGPTSALAMAVDEAHDGDDPVAALTIWQRDRLTAWRADPSPLTSPISWAAVSSHVCRPRPVLPPHPENDGD